jgi:hypothetical protein
MNDRLVDYPFVVVRVGCELCGRRTANYRLARLAAKFGPEISLRQLVEYLSWDCPVRDPAIPSKRRRHRDVPCGAKLIDLNGPPRPPDMPATMMRLKVVGEKG